VHGHDSAWCVVLTGRKRWFLLPPGALGPKDRFWADNEHPLVRLQALEAMRDRGLAFDVTQSPGDVLYIPADWVHLTVNTCETVAISQEFGYSGPWYAPLDNAYTLCAVDDLITQ